MEFLTLRPAPQLASFVASYWFVKDIQGDFEGQPICTSPTPMAVLSVNLGRANAAEDGSLVPSTSLLGLQSRTRSWRSWSDTNFVMAMLSVPGIVRLFPHAGAGTADRILDLGALIGDACSRSLARRINSDMNPKQIASQLDKWLIARVHASTPVRESTRLAAAHDILRCGGSVVKAAEAADIDRRQLQRWFHRHLGVGPKDLADLERLQKSLRSVQTKHGDSHAGFSDQAHQIRTWRRRLGVTPTVYDKMDCSPMAAYFSSNDGETGPAFYL